MELTARILAAVPAGLQPAERAGGITCTAPDSEPVCIACNRTGWRRAEEEDFYGFRRCQCAKARIRAARLSTIPELFRDVTFDSYRPRSSRQGLALAAMRTSPGGSWYLTGGYGNGKSHLLYAQYRELVTAGNVRCHVRTTRELVEELRRAELDNVFVSPVIASASKHEPYHLFWDDIDKLKTTDFKPRSSSTSWTRSTGRSTASRSPATCRSGISSTASAASGHHPPRGRHVHCSGGVSGMKPGDRVIWLRSHGRSFLTGWRVQAIPGEVVRICRHRIRIRVRLGGDERLVLVDPENVLSEKEVDSRELRASSGVTKL